MIADKTDRLLRVEDILGDEKTNRKPMVPVCRATWYSLIRQGRIPKPIKVGALSMWRLSEIQKFIAEGSA